MFAVHYDKKDKKEVSNMSHVKIKDKEVEENAN